MAVAAMLTGIKNSIQVEDNLTTWNEAKIKDKLCPMVKQVMSQNKGFHCLAEKGKQSAARKSKWS